MKAGKTLLFLILLLPGFSCSPVRIVDAEGESGFNLSDYQTYNFFDIVEGGDTVLQAYTEEMDLLKSEIATQLEERGLSRSPEPELLVNIGTVVEEKVQTRETHIREAPIYIGQRRYSWQSREVPVGRYRQGTVSVHLVDPEENRLMWRGVAEGVIPDDLERLQERIEKGVDELFERVPGAD